MVSGLTSAPKTKFNRSIDFPETPKVEYKIIRETIGALELGVDFNQRFPEGSQKWSYSGPIVVLEGS